MKLKVCPPHEYQAETFAGRRWAERVTLAHHTLELHHRDGLAGRAEFTVALLPPERRAFLRTEVLVRLYGYPADVTVTLDRSDAPGVLELLRPLLHALVGVTPPEAEGDRCTEWREPQEDLTPPW